MKAYTVAIPNLPLFPNRRVKEFCSYINSLDGFIGIHPSYPYGTILLFKTKNHAIRGRNLIRAYRGYNGMVGDNICEVEIGDEHDKI